MKHGCLGCIWYVPKPRGCNTPVCSHPHGCKYLKMTERDKRQKELEERK